MITFTRTAHHALSPEQAREVVTTTAARLGFAPEPSPGEELVFRRGTWPSYLFAMNPARLRAWLRVGLRPGEAALELRVRDFMTILFPQDRRYYETELEALESALHGRAPERTPGELEREAQVFSWLAVALVALAVISGALAKAAGWF